MNHTIPTETTKLQREVIRLREIIASHEAARKLRLAEEEAAAATSSAAALVCAGKVEALKAARDAIALIDDGEAPEYRACQEAIDIVTAGVRKRAEAAAVQPAAPAVDAAKLDDLGKLKALAEAATQGPWLHRHDPGNPVGVQHGVKLEGEFGAWVCDCLDNADRTINPTAGERNAAYIAAANPAAILRIAALVAQQAARIKELERAQQLYREGTKEALVDLFQRMEKSYSAEPTRRITFMDMETAHVHVARLGFGGCLDAAMKEGK